MTKLLDKPTTGKRSGPIKSNFFPAKLYSILSEPKFAGKYLEWLPHGRAWYVYLIICWFYFIPRFNMISLLSPNRRIIKLAEFARDVLPRYFRHSNYASFMRQVNGWGFRRLYFGRDQQSYFHEVCKYLNDSMILS